MKGVRFCFTLWFLLINLTAAQADVVLKGTVHWENVEGRIGVRIADATGKVIKVYHASPAEAAGIRAEDVIVEVDGQRGHISKISGEPETSVHLQIRRGSEYFEVDVVRVDYRLISY
jgi:C-terminal processing protease CtpA/Prc